MSLSPRDSTEHLSAQAHLHDDGRKRVAKACDRCRLKKIKCDGRIPCTRCKLENAVCRFGDRRKTVERRVPPGYVEYLEEQQRVLVTALRMTYKTVPNANPSPDVSVHHILDRLGVLDNMHHSTVLNSPFHFEEDLDKLRDNWDEHADAASDVQSVPSVPSLSPTTSLSTDSARASPASLSSNLSALPVGMPPQPSYMSRPSFASSSSTSSSMSDFSLPQHAYQVPSQRYQQSPASPAPPQPSGQGVSPLWTAMPGDDFAHFPVQSPDAFGDFDSAQFDAFAAQMTVTPNMLQGGQYRPLYPGDMDVDNYSNARKWAPPSTATSWPRVGM